jgi:hypothetical protein
MVYINNKLPTLEFTVTPTNNNNNNNNAESDCNITLRSGWELRSSEPFCNE